MVHRKRFLELAATFVALSIPALVALAPPSSTAAGAPLQVAPSVDHGTRLFTVPLGSRSTDLGTVEGGQAARILPAAFDVDADAREIDVLDTANARVATFSFEGRRLRATDILTRSRTVGDLLRLPDGTRYLLDVSRNELIKWTTHGQTVIEHAGMGAEAVNARLVADGPTVGVHDAVNVSVDGASVLLNGIRLGFGRTVFDVAESAVGPDGILWALVDVDDGAGGAAMDLLSIDLRHPNNLEARTIDAGILGDVTRRIVPLARRGVVVMSGTRSELIFTKYGER